MVVINLWHCSVHSIETKATGGWLDKTTGSFESSYMLLLLLDTMTKTARSSSLDSYRLFWASITPPSQLMECVLEDHSQPNMDAIKVDWRFDFTISQFCT